MSTSKRKRAEDKPQGLMANFPQPAKKSKSTSSGKQRAPRRKAGAWDTSTLKRVLVYDIGEINLVDAVVVKFGGCDDYAIERIRKTNLRLEEDGVDRGRSLSTERLASAIKSYLLRTVAEVTAEPLDAIVVELQQLGRVGQRMLPFQIGQFFELYHHWHGLPCPRVEFQTGAQKFRVVVDVPSSRRDAGRFDRRPQSLYELRRDGATATYAANKAYAVRQMRYMLASYPRLEPWRAMFAAEAKKDDIADAVVHGVFYLNVGSSTVPRKWPDGVVVLRGAPVAVSLTDIHTHDTDDDNVVDLTNPSDSALLARCRASPTSDIERDHLTAESDAESDRESENESDYESDASDSCNTTLSTHTTTPGR